MEEKSPYETRFEFTKYGFQFGSAPNCTHMNISCQKMKIYDLF